MGFFYFYFLTEIKYTLSQILTLNKRKEAIRDKNIKKVKYKDVFILLIKVFIVFIKAYIMT